MDQVLIVGAGPVGLTLAPELARYGVPMRLIDRSAQPTATFKALFVWSRTLELLGCMGCTPAFLAAGLRAQGATIRNGRTVLSPTWHRLGRPGSVDLAGQFLDDVPASTCDALQTSANEGITTETTNSTFFPIGLNDMTASSLG